MCRILESIIAEKVMDYVLSNNLLSHCQFGFLPGRSTCTQLLAALNKWHNSYDSGINIHIVYTSISKAFDTVSHTKLLSVLKSYGIADNTFNWIRAFITGRCQCVCITVLVMHYHLFYESLVVFHKAVYLNLFCFYSLLII